MKNQIIIAIDGRCASGKTTLAERLRQTMNCNVFHMDEFFLRPEQRSEERLRIPGENVDHERFEEEVLKKITRNEPFSYQPFDCKTQMLRQAIHVMPSSINIVEGSYSCHPQLMKYYDLKVFLSIDPYEQLERIRLRNGKDAVKIFEERWIPLEETYFAQCNIEEQCDMSFILK